MFMKNMSWKKYFVVRTWATSKAAVLNYWEVAVQLFKKILETSKENIQCLIFW